MSSLQFKFLQDVKLTIDVDGDFNEKPTIEINPTGGCQPHGEVCLKTTSEYDAVLFNGKLTKVPAEYTATLKDSKSFKFFFGENPVTSSTAETTPASESTVTGESSGSDTNYETVPTTSSGQSTIASVVLILGSFFMHALT